MKKMPASLCHTRRRFVIPAQAGISLLTFAFLAACGDTVENTTINQTGLDVIASEGDLPRCTGENEGDQVLVKEDGSVRVCFESEWKSMSLDGAGSDFSCKTEELKDKSGLKIVCNGDSIGVVLNGSDGKQGASGKDGKAGSGCAMKDKTDSTITVVCGDSTMVIELGAGSDVAEPDSERTAISLDSLAGYTQKGPFLKGSTVYLYELSDGRTLKQTNGNFTSFITRDDGRYKFTARDLVSQYAMIVVEGNYRNEVTGKPSNATIRLRALTDMRKHSDANINLLTHLEFDRVYYLVTREGLTVKKAKKQAQNEIFNAFHIDTASVSGSAEDLNVFGKSDADAALLAISVLLQGDGNETDLSVLLTEISNDMESDGLWNDSAARVKIADWAMAVDTAGRLDSIRAYVKGWGLGDGNVPDFEKRLRAFWSTENGLGVCGDSKNPVGTVKQISNPKSDYYAENYTAADAEGRRLRFICENADRAKWRVAADIEMDRFDWNPENDSSGTLLAGPFTGRPMVWDADTLRYADSVEVAWNRGCVSYIYDSSYVLENQLSHYKCTNGQWIFDVEGSTGSTGTSYGNYKTIAVGQKLWLAENLHLAYMVDGTKYGYSCWKDSCNKYGSPRGYYYTWAAAMDSAGNNYRDGGKGCGYHSPSSKCDPTYPVRGICFSGWHLPDTSEWKALFNTVGGMAVAGRMLKSTSSWNKNGNGLDAYGFSAIPTGYASSSNLIPTTGDSLAYFWTSSKGRTYERFYVNLTHKQDSVFLKSSESQYLFNVRCIKD